MGNWRSMKRLAVVFVLMLLIFVFAGCSRGEGLLLKGDHTLKVVFEDRNGEAIEGSVEVWQNGSKIAGPKTGSSVEFQLDDGTYELHASTEYHSLPFTEVVIDGDDVIQKMTSSLAAYFPMEGNLEDSNGYYDAGTVIGNRINADSGGSITFSEGKKGQAAVFDGQSGVRLPDGLITDYSYTVSMWLNPTEITPFTTTFFGGVPSGDASSQWVSFVPLGPLDATMLWSGEQWYDATTYMQIETNTWSHIAFSVDKGYVSVYINGEERFTGSGFPDIFSGGDALFSLGVNWWDPPYQGMIDELYIFDKAITREQVSHLAEGAPEIDEGTGPQFREVSVHDPSVIKDNGIYYLFGSHLASAKSGDLIQWEQISSHVHDGNPLIPNVYEEMQEALEWAQTDTFWAGDVTRLNDGKYYMYYSVCEGTSPRSALGLAVSDYVDGPYENVKILLKSGMEGTSEDGTLYDATIHPNVIDPHTFYDAEGKLWMVYGSYSGGIFILEMDPETGLPYPGQGYGKKLLGGNHSRIEAPYILFSPDTGYYYLFLSFGGLDANGGYNIRVVRSENPDGPYFDAAGNNMIDCHGPDGSFFDDEAIEPYGVKLFGNFRFLDTDGNATGIGYVSPGHNSAYYEEENGKYYVFFHSRFPGKGEMHQVRVHQMFINDEGWPVIAPHRYAGETIENYSLDEITGEYAFVNHGKDISAEIKDSIVVSLNEDSTIGGSVSGQWSQSGEYGIELTIDGISYSGVLLRQWDDGIEQYVMTFSALSKNGIAIWGSQLPN